MSSVSKIKSNVIKLRLLILFSACACVFLSSYTEAEPPVRIEKTHYYSKLTGIISPYLEYNPRGRISKDSLRFFNYYKVIYTGNEQLKEICYYVNNKPSNDSYFGTHKVSYTHFDSTIVRTYYDTNNRKSNLWRHYYLGGNIHQEVFELDHKGKKSKLILLDSLNNRVSTKLNVYEYRWESLSDTSFVQRQFDKHGRPALLTNYFPFYTSKISIDLKGHLYGIYNLNDTTEDIEINDIAGYAKVIFDFDEHGNEMGWRFYDDEGNLANRLSIENTDYGYAQWLYENSVWRDREKGLLKYFEQNLYDATGTPTNDNDSIQKIQYFLNESSILDSVLRYNRLGIPQENKTTNVFKTEFRYDTDGNRIQIIDYDIERKIISK
ncbi:MAG: hypothetical protein AAFO07_06965 [Bacteroidota bacterium]